MKAKTSKENIKHKDHKNNIESRRRHKMVRESAGGDVLNCKGPLK